ncbi:transporter suffix domain-containing protein [Candidatus Margulisiibacteriota bacterium]
MPKQKLFNFKGLFAVFLMAISNLGWALPVFLIPFLEIPLKTKALLTTSLIVFGQVTFNLGLILLGGQVIHRLRKEKINLKHIGDQFRILLKIKKKK